MCLLLGTTYFVHVLRTYSLCRTIVLMAVEISFSLNRGFLSDIGITITGICQTLTF